MFFGVVVYSYYFFASWWIGGSVAWLVGGLSIFVDCGIGVSVYRCIGVLAYWVHWCIGVLMI